jgi:ribulose-5-phosphate 4-epimerase/fuculose-1-phosphate aldolase
MKKLLELAHSLDKFVIGGEGNVSCKLTDSFMIKASGKSLRNLSEKDLVLCDMSGNKIDSSDLQPSIETGFHSWLLSQPGINYISHTHPVNTLQILCSDYIFDFATKRLFPDQVVFNGSESCIVGYAHPGDELLEKIKISTREYNNKLGVLPKLILLKNHGIICIGSTMEECLISTEMCEKSAEIFLGVKKIGDINCLSLFDIQKIESDKKEEYRKQLLK